MAILSADELHSLLDKVDLSSTSKCKCCGNLPEWYSNENISILRCSSCKSPSRGFICRVCQKSESDVDKSSLNLIRSWNSKNG